jgi:hypothetical protein
MTISTQLLAEEMPFTSGKMLSPGCIKSLTWWLPIRRCQRKTFHSGNAPAPFRIAVSSPFHLEGEFVIWNARERWWGILLMAGVLSAPYAVLGADQDNKTDTKKEENTISGPGTLWREPLDIASRDTYYGPGGKEHEPVPPFHFVKEDLSGSSPKFNVTDAKGIKWKVKLGREARPETAATRLAWAAGYFTNEDYLVRDIPVVGLPLRLKRGADLVGKDGIIAYARLKRDNGKKIGIWDWRDPYLANTRELNGLKVIMALLNNWDLKNINNAVYERDGQRYFEVSDLGASFGTPGRSFPASKAKDNLEEYSKSKFIKREDEKTVDFTTPARPGFVFIVDPKEYVMRVQMESLGQHIPKEDVWWIGQQLAALSPKQIRDAFRAAGYSDAEVEQLAQVIETRIAQLTDM